MENNNFAKLINKAKEDKDSLMQLINKMQPLIKSYIRKLFFMEPEDAEQELTLAIIEAVRGIPSCDTDGQCMSYIRNAVRFKFAHLCKKNIRKESIETPFEKILDDELSFIEIYDDIEIQYDIEKLTISKKQQKILRFLLLGNSDREIADKMGISRQYVNRIKKKILNELYEKRL